MGTLTPQRRLPRPRTVLLAWVSLIASSASMYAVVHYVTPEGSAAPESDQPSRPWQLVEAAARALPAQGGTVSIDPGLYRERFTLDTPTVLTAPGGRAVIGDMTTGVEATTTLSVFTWNTHEFGDYPLLPSWQDYQRADDMGAYFAGRHSELDVVALCEVWDEDLFVGGGGAVGIRPRSGYPNWMNFTDIKGGLVSCGPIPAPRILHSGLSLMSQYPLSDYRRVHYDDCDGDCPGISESPDCLASKGFMAATLVKDGFSTRVYVTHTQAGYGANPVAVRQKQVVQLARDVAAFQAANPSQVVLVMGDMNVVGDTTSEYDFMRDQLGAIGGRDAARNAADVSIYQDPSIAHTLASFNELALYFDPHPYDQRLDYVWYFPSQDGRVRLQPIHVDRVLIHGPVRSADGLTSDELSDHYPVEAAFRLVSLL